MFDETVSVLPSATAPVRTERFATFRPTPAPRTFKFATLAIPATDKAVVPGVVFVANRVPCTVNAFCTTAEEPVPETVNVP